MAQTLDNTFVNFAIGGTVNNVKQSVQAVQSVLSIAYSNALTSGTLANQADRIWFDTRTIAASGTDTIDLNGVLTDIIGTTISLLRVKALYVKAYAANTNNVLVGGAGSNQWATWISAATSSVTVRPGGALMLFAPDATAYAVTAATGDILQVANSGAGTSVQYDIVVIGSSA